MRNSGSLPHATEEYPFRTKHLKKYYQFTKKELSVKNHCIKLLVEES
jgi:hypothetical protein